MGYTYREGQLKIIYVILNFPTLDFFILKIKEQDFQPQSLYISTYISCFKSNLKIFFFSSPQIIDPVFNIYHYRMDGFVYLSQKKEDFSKFRFENQSNIQKRRSTRPNHFILEIHRNIGPYLFLCLIFSSGQTVKYFTF